MLLTAIQSVREAASRLEKAVCSREELTVIVEAPGGTPSAAYIKYELQQARVTSFGAIVKSGV
jgi:hypothetical protein